MFLLGRTASGFNSIDTVVSNAFTTLTVTLLLSVASKSSFPKNLMKTSFSPTLDGSKVTEVELEPSSPPKLISLTHNSRLSVTESENVIVK